MVDVHRYIKSNETIPDGTISLAEAMEKVVGKSYISPDQLAQMLQVFRAMPEGNEKFIFARGLLSYCGDTLVAIVEFGVIEEFGASSEGKGIYTKNDKKYVLTSTEQDELVRQFRTVYSPVGDELNSFTFPGEQLK